MVPLGLPSARPMAQALRLPFEYYIYGKETIYMYSRPKPRNKHCITLKTPLANKVTAKRTIAIQQEINILLLLIYKHTL